MKETHCHHLVAQDAPDCRLQARFETLGNDRVYVHVLEDDRPPVHGVHTRDGAGALYRRLKAKGWVQPEAAPAMTKHEFFTWRDALQKI